MEQFTVYLHAAQQYQPKVIWGEEVLKDLMPLYKIMVHEDLDGNGYSVSEFSAGASIAYASTRRRAVKIARDKLNKVTQEQFGEIVSKAKTQRKEFFKSQMHPLWVIMSDCGHTLLQDEVLELYNAIKDNGYKLVKIEQDEHPGTIS